MIPHDNSLAPWLTLKSIKGVGNITFKKIVQVFKEPGLAISSPYEELMKRAGIHENLAKRISGAKVCQEILKELELAEKFKIRILTFNNSRYPSILKEIPDPPPYIYVHGDIQPEIPRIAIVGSRNATYYGMETAHKLGKEISGLGIEIVSGMARGIDSSAHEGAIAGGGRTIAVLGSGLNRIYPPENLRLFHKIAENGAVISEFPINEGPEAKNFPMRNRIICGLSSGVVVVEAGNKSGSLITAKLAAEQGREVFAVPGSINSSRSTGTHSLLRQGATLIENAEDILTELPYLAESLKKSYLLKTNLESSSKKNHEEIDEQEKNVLAKLDAYPMHIDEIGRKCGLGPGKVSCILLELELKGLIHQLPGKLYALKEDKNWQNR